METKITNEAKPSTEQYSHVPREIKEYPLSELNIEISAWGIGYDSTTRTLMWFLGTTERDLSDHIKIPCVKFLWEEPANAIEKEIEALAVQRGTAIPHTKFWLQLLKGYVEGKNVEAQ